MAVSVFYFYDPDQEVSTGGDGDFKVYELSSTTDISISSPAVVTKSPVEDGSSIVDNYFIDNKTATFSGIITQLRVAGQDGRTDTSVWIQSIRSLRASKKLLTLVAHTEILQNCLITKFDINKNVEQGLTGWKCEMEFQEVDISERARLVAVREATPETKDQVEAENKSSSQVVKEVPYSKSLILTAVDDIQSIGGGG